LLAPRLRFEQELLGGALQTAGRAIGGGTCRALCARMTKPTRSSMTWTIAAALACTAGCMTDEMTAEDEAAEIVDETEQGIHSGGVTASTFQIQRAAILTNLGTRATRRCTATVIGPSHILMAARCKPLVEERILFYSSSVANEASDRTIIAVNYPPGVNPNNGDITDSDDKFADLAIVRVSTPIPSYSVPATLAWHYPLDGNDEGVKVGAGQHQLSSTPSLLRQVGDVTYSGNDDGGSFLTAGQHTNAWDEGGPFYFQNRVVGVLHGGVWEWGNKDAYSSVPESLDWILDHNSYAWGGIRYMWTRISSGTMLDSFPAESEKVCQYACEKHSSCVGYSYTTNQPYCRTYSLVTATEDSTYHRMGRI
jgi:hypothetical protein